MVRVWMGMSGNVVMARKLLYVLCMDFSSWMDEEEYFFFF